MNSNDRTGWQGSTPPSLIQQRMDIDRVRTRGLIGIWGGVAFFVFWLAQLGISGFNALYLLQLTAAIILLGVGAKALAEHKRKIASFEAKNGVGAGKQDPIV